MENRYFDRPKQVMFFEAENQEWCVGIAYKDEIICACCGGIFNIDEVYELADDLGIEEAVHPYENWCNIKDEVAGGERDEDNDVWNPAEENNDFPAD